MKKIAALTLALLVLTGCSGATIWSNYKELETLELVLTLGFDKEPEKVRITAGTGVGIKNERPKIYTRRGMTMAQAVSELKRSTVGHETYFAHTENLVLGQQAAEKNLAGCLDYAERNMDIRFDVSLFVVKDGTAGDLITNCAGEQSSATDMLRLLRREAPFMGRGYAVSCGEVAAALAERGCGVIMAVRTKKSEKLSAEDGELMILPAGYAVISEGKLAGWLDDGAETGATILLGKLKNLPLVFDEGGSRVSVGVTEAEAAFQPIFSDKKLERLEIVVEARADVIEVDGDYQPSDEESRSDLSDRISALLKLWIEDAVAKTQGTGADALGLGGMAERERPAQFRKIKESWKEIYPQLDVAVTVHTDIKRSFDLDTPLPTEGEQK